MNNFTISVANSNNTASFEFNVSNSPKLILTYLWVYATAYDTVTTTYINVPVLLELGSSALTQAFVDVAQGFTMVSGALAYNGRKVCASNSMCWTGEAALPAGVMRGTFSIPYTPVNVTTFSFYAQLSFK